MDRVVYFAASVFWRAAVYTWRWDDRLIKIELGKYAEQLRLFLLGETPFPDRMTLSVWVSGLKGDLLAVCRLPESKRKDGFPTHQFTIPGLMFELMVAGHMPEKYHKWATSAPERFLAIVPRLDVEDVLNMARRLQSVHRI